MAASFEGKYVQSFPAFGPERRGAPVLSFTRISDEPIEIHSMIYEPDIVVVLDYTLLSPSVLSGLKPGGFIISNYTGNVDEALEKLNIRRGGYRIILIPASKLAYEILRTKITNTAMLAGLVKAGILRLESVEKAVRQRFPEPIAEKNINLIHASLKEVVEV